MSRAGNGPWLGGSEGSTVERDWVAVVLASGLGRRFGRSKARLFWPEEGSLLACVCHRAEHWADQVLAVVAETDVEQVPPGVESAVNLDPASGISSSLRLAASTLVGRGVDAVAVLLVDQPFVTTEDGQYMRDQWQVRAPGIRALRPVYNGQPGHPVVLEYAWFESLAGSLVGDHGLFSVLRESPAVGVVSRLIVDRPRPAFDIDNPEDYQAALAWV